MSSPVSLGRWVRTASIRSFASDVVRVSASLNSWPTQTLVRREQYGVIYRVWAVWHLLLLYLGGDDDLAVLRAFKDDRCEKRIPKKYENLGIWAEAESAYGWNWNFIIHLIGAWNYKSIWNTLNSENCVRLRRCCQVSSETLEIKQVLKLEQKA